MRMARHSIIFTFAKSERFSLARLTLAGLFCVSLSAAAFAESDRWARCRGADTEARIAGCTEVIARGGRETKRNQITAYINRGEAYRAKGDFDRAIADLDKALQLDSKSAVALTDRASIYQAKGDLDRAIADYDRALQLDKNLATSYGGRAGVYRGKGDLDRALADFNEAVKLDPKPASLHVNRGVVYQAKGDLDLAIADYDEAIERDPTLASAHNNRGLAFSAKGDFDKALTDFNKALELDPKSADAFLNRANVYRGKQDFERAKRDLEAALKLDPQLASAKDALDEVNRLIAKSAAPPTAAAPTAPAAPAAKAPSDRPARPSPLANTVLFHVGPAPITRPVVTTWAIMLVLTISSWLVTRRLRQRPDQRGAMLELVVTGITEQIEEVIRTDPRPFLPLIGTLFIFLVTANLSGVLPGVEAPTSKLETPAALAFIVFVSVHYFGVRVQGSLGYLGSFAKPRLIMLPLNIVSQLTRTFSLMVRLFGNVMSGEFVIALVVALAGLFVPIPLMALEILVGIVQAYIFAVLATVFIGAAIGSVEQG
jgi:F-type H+-transporting ATPase subunit a